jgi:hypothetical protein
MKTIKISLVSISLFMSLGIFGQPCPTGLNKPGTFTQNGTTIALPAAVTDGNTSTLALSFAGYMNVPSIVIDLGAKYDLTTILFIWGSINKPSQYAVAISANGFNYTDNISVTNNTASSDLRTFSSTAKFVQYVKISNLYRVSPYTIDLYDIQICGAASACGSGDGAFKKLTICEAAGFYGGITSLNPSAFGSISAASISSSGTISTLHLNASGTITATTMSATGKISAGSFYTSGHVGIGCSNPSVELAVNGKIQASELELKASPCVADYVFEKNYNLMNLNDLSKFLATNKHLPEVPSAAEFKEKGLNVAEMNNLLLKKVEELTLYVIEQQKQIEDLILRNGLK